MQDLGKFKVERCLQDVIKWLHMEYAVNYIYTSISFLNFYQSGKTFLDYDSGVSSIILAIKENPEIAMCKDSHGVPIIKDHRLDKFRTGFLSIDFSDTSLTYNQNELWFHLIQISEDENTANICDIIVRIINKYPYLVDAKDANGRTAVNVATASNARAINSIILLHGRYKYTGT